jgi:hypothetical protein
MAIVHVPSSEELTMIRHTVLFNLKSDVSKQEVENIFTDIINLTTKLQGILAITGGTCYFHDKNSGQPFTHGFSIDFSDKSARDSFLNDSVTDPVKDKIINVAQGGNKGVIGFDFGEWN